MMRVAALLILSAAFAMGDSVQDLVARGDDLDAKFQNQEAVKFYLEANALQPKDADILQRIAKQYGLAMNDVIAKSEKRAFGEKALDYARQAVTADARNANAQLALSVSYGRLAELSDNKTKIAYSKLIKDHALKSMELNPSNDLPYFIMAEWNYGLANLNPVVRALAQAVYGELPAASNEEAIRYYRKALQINPNRIGTLAGLGKALAAADDKAAARAALEKALALPNREKDDDFVKTQARETLRKL